MSLTFNIETKDISSKARLGKVTTCHGSFDTPTFMPVGTRATVKGLLPQIVDGLGAQIILANTYHLMLRPGSQLVADMGGLHKWMNWKRPILTDSGGYQVFSLSKINKITDTGVTFKSHIDGQTIELTPQRSIEVQNQLGADIIMAFDDCPPAGGGQDAGSAMSVLEYGNRVDQANQRTIRWLEQCVQAHRRPDEQALFGIVQGGVDLEKRSWCAAKVAEFDLPGYAIGGVAVGEGPDLIQKVVEHTAPLLPENKPRYLMGVGYERDILKAVQSGVDMFDCVLPTRNGRNANAFTSTGQIRLKNAKFAKDHQVIEPGCDCIACSGNGQENSNGFSRSYIRHLFQVGEMLGPILVSGHNIRHFQRFMLDIRRSIRHNNWSLLRRNWPVSLQ